MSKAPELIWVEERFWPNVDVSDGCWNWTGTKMGNGYGAIPKCKGGRVTGAHRFSWYIHNGEWPPKGMVVMHSCDNPSCVRPDHLSIGTQSENIKQCVDRGRHKPFRPEKKEECKNGHPYTEENTQYVMSRGLKVRRCRTCKNEASMRWKVKNNAAK